MNNRPPSILSRNSDSKNPKLIKFRRYGTFGSAKKNSTKNVLQESVNAFKELSQKQIPIFFDDAYFNNRNEYTDLRDNSESKMAKLDICKIKSQSFAIEKHSIISPLVKIYRSNKENVESRQRKKNSENLNKFKISLNEVPPTKFTIDRVKSKSTMSGNITREVIRTPLKNRKMEMMSYTGQIGKRDVAKSSNNIRKSVISTKNNL